MDKLNFQISFDLQSYNEMESFKKLFVKICCIDFWKRFETSKG